MSLKSTWKISFKGSELKVYCSRCIQAILREGGLSDSARTERLHQLNDFLLMFERSPDSLFELDAEDIRFFEVSVSLSTILT